MQAVTARNWPMSGMRQWTDLCEWQPVDDYAKFNRENRCKKEVLMAHDLINDRFSLPLWSLSFSLGWKTRFTSCLPCLLVNRRSKRSVSFSRNDNEVSLTIFWAQQLENVCAKAVPWLGVLAEKALSAHTFPLSNETGGFLSLDAMV